MGREGGVEWVLGGYYGEDEFVEGVLCELSIVLVEFGERTVRRGAQSPSAGFCG